jgi:hypothetical protein
VVILTSMARKDCEWMEGTPRLAARRARIDRRLGGLAGSGGIIRCPRTYSCSSDLLLEELELLADSGELVGVAAFFGVLDADRE